VQAWGSVCIVSGRFSSEVIVFCASSRREFRLKGKVLGDEFSILNGEFVVLGLKFGDVRSDVRGVDEAGEKRVDLGDDSFLILGEGARGFQHSVHERQDFNSLCARCVGDFENCHDERLRSVEYRIAT
jgi:hypothetical protein